jgi:hypothetical protein
MCLKPDSGGEGSPRRARNILASLPGLTRQSIHFERVLRRWMDARVKPAHDGDLGKWGGECWLQA